MGDKYKVITITSGAYPYGGASTNRHISYLRGLVELQNSVEVLVISPAKKQPALSNKVKVKLKGINFYYTSNTTSYISNKYKRLVNRFLGLFKTLRVVKSIRRETKGKEVILLILTSDVFEIIPFIIYSKLKKIKIFHERTEHPFVNISNSKISIILTKFYIKNLVPKFTGIFVITKFLKTYFNQYIDDNKVKVIPMVVEPDRFLNITEVKVEEKPYIAYCGSMYTNKDGVPSLLEAFDKVAEEFKDLELYLIGDNSDSKRFQYISDKINSLKAKDRVKCTGLISRDEMPHYLVGAKLLVLSRPSSLQADAGFPTKLGEYLASKTPIVITRVGEIPDYLTDGVNAFIAEPDNAESFSNKIKEALNNYERAIEIGEKGELLTKSVFNYKEQAKNINSFFDSF